MSLNFTHNDSDKKNDWLQIDCFIRKHSPAKNNNPPHQMITEIAFILDRSGSMESVRQAAIDGFNEFLRDQQAAPGTVRLTLILFDNEILTIHDAVPIAEILPLDHDTFVPRGSTALLDAIGDTIDRLGKRFANSSADQKPGHVAVAILTDGEENSSRRFTWQDIAARISHQTEKYQWDFLFLGAGVDAIATAAKMSIAAHNSAQYSADATGQYAASASLSRKVRYSRAVKSGHATPEQIEEAARPLQDILREEDGKRRE